MLQCHFTLVNFILISIAFSFFIDHVCTLCLGTTATPICLENMAQDEVNEKLEYVLSKYEEVDMKIIGTPIGVRGKRIVDGNTEELNIVFQYIDHTVHDVMQTCAFILITKPGECETISTICNTFLRATPRPLLQREDLNVCEDENNAGAETETDGEQPMLARDDEASS